MSTDDQAMSFEAGRIPPYVMLGNWVGLSPLTIQAKCIYWHMAMHLNPKSGNNEIWPSRKMLARAIGVKNAKSVDRYISELEAFGAIEKTIKISDKGDNDNNRYVVHLAPPEGFIGIDTMKQWYAAQRNTQEPAKDKTAAQGVVTYKSLPHTDQAKRHNRSSGGSDLQVTRGSDLQVTQRINNSTNALPPAPQADVAGPTAAKIRKREGEDGRLRQPKIQDPKITAFVDALPTGGKARGARHHANLLAEVARLAAGGADLGKVRIALLADLNSAGHWFSTMAARAKEFTPDRFQPVGSAIARKASVKGAEDATGAPMAPRAPLGSGLSPMSPEERRAERNRIAAEAKAEMAAREAAEKQEGCEQNSAATHRRELAAA